MSENFDQLFSGKKILIVEDEDFLLEAMVEEFSYAGARVFSATSGNAAFKIISEHPVDIVLTDIQMSDGDGVELLKKINMHIKPLPILCVCSGYSDSTDSDLKSLNVKEIFKKPFQWKELMLGIVKHL